MTKKIIFVLAVVVVAVVVWQGKPEAQPQPTELDTTGWVTFRSEKYGFEIKHPSDWMVEIAQLSSGKEFVRFKTPNFGITHSDVFSVISFPKSIEDVVSDTKASPRYTGGTVITKQTIFNGIPAIVIIGTEANNTKEEDLFIEGITYNYSIGRTSENYLEWQDILSTFRLLQ